AFQGDHGAYSEEAVAAWWEGAAVPVPARECADVARLVESGDVDHGVLAIENTLAGSVVAAYDALAAAAGVTVVGEVVLPMHHCVLAPPGATLATVATVESHPVALAQCGRFLAAHPHIEARAAYDTAGAARAVAARDDGRAGAIAGRGAAQRFGLVVLAANVEDRPDNQTRFLVLARGGAPLSASSGPPAPDRGAPAGAPLVHTGHMRTALIAVTDNVPGALLHLLAPLAAAALNVSKIESRPTGVPWAYRFFVEVEHDADDPRLGDALAAVRGAARDLRVLGTFERARPAAGSAVGGLDG
ncbi:MAG TPA: prephenate dehydratase domain-containing protein, partial [Gemmatirosa sp.]